MVAPADDSASGPRLDARRALVFARARLRQGRRRVRMSVVPVAQAAAGAALAWFIAHDLMGQGAPIVAPVSAWVCLGFTKNRVPRRVAELGVGATVGVLIGDLVAVALGVGPLQIGLVCLAAALLGRLVDHGDMVTIQATVNGIVIVGLSSVAIPGGTGGRWLDALLGAAIAFVIAVLLPRGLSERPRRYARAVFEELARALDMLADAHRTGDVEAMQDVFAQLRAVGELVDDYEAVLATASDIVKLNPTLRADRPQIAELQRLLVLVRRTEVTLTMLTRQSLVFSEQSGRMPGMAEPLAGAASATNSIAAAVGGWSRPVWARQKLAELASHSSPREVESDDWRPAALRALLRALLVDLMQVTGLSRADANARLNDTLDATYGPDAATRPDHDGPSALWA